MSTILVTYSDESCTISKKVCCDAAMQNGVDKCWPQSPDTISQEFKDMNPVLREVKGAGYWLWKPYHVYKAILKCGDGDVLIYCDAGFKLISNVNHIISVMNQQTGRDKDIFLFSNGHQHIHWTKADIIKSILHVDMIPAAHEQVQASLIFFRVNDYTRKFCKDWLTYSQLPGLIDDSPSVLPNHPEFAENRYDQAILGTLALRYNIPLHWWPDALWYQNQRYRWPADLYPPMGEHHRKRNPGVKTNPEGPTW